MGPGCRVASGDHDRNSTIHEEYRTFVEDISGEDLCDASALEILEVAKRVDALSVANAQTRLRLHTLPMCTHSNPTADAPALGPGDISYSNDDVHCDFAYTLAHARS